MLIRSRAEGCQWVARSGVGVLRTDGPMWPLAVYKIGKANAVDVIIEPRVGGRGQSAVMSDDRTRRAGDRNPRSLRGASR